MKALNIAALFLLCIVPASAQTESESGAETTYGISFSAGSQMIDHSAQSQFFENITSDPNSFHRLDRGTTLQGFVTFYNVKQKHIFITVGAERFTLLCVSDFVMNGMRTGYADNPPLSSIHSEHTVIPLSVMGGVFLRGEGMRVGLRFALGLVFAFGSITETMTVSGYTPAFSSIDGTGIGGRGFAGLHFRVTPPVNIITDLTYSYISMNYPANENNYTANRHFIYNGFGFRGGVELEL